MATFSASNHFSCNPKTLVCHPPGGSSTQTICESERASQPRPLVTRDQENARNDAVNTYVGLCSKLVISSVLLFFSPAERPPAFAEMSLALLPPACLSLLSHVLSGTAPRAFWGSRTDPECPPDKWNEVGIPGSLAIKSSKSPWKARSGPVRLEH